MEATVEYSVDKGKLIEALCKAKLEFEPITKDGKAKTEKFNYDYASLDMIIKATDKALSNNGLNIRHFNKVTDDGKLWIVSELRHISGCEPDRTETPIERFASDSQRMSAIQAFGSIITYLKRYHIGQLLNIAIDEDDDGQVKEQTKKDKPKSTLETLTNKYFKLASSNEAERHKWQTDNIGKASTKEWTEADFQKAIDLLEKGNGHKPTALESLKANLDTVKTIKELEDKYKANKKAYESKDNKDDILALYASRKHQLTLEDIQNVTNAGFGLTDIDAFLAQAGDIKSLVEEAILGTPVAIETLSNAIITYLEKDDPELPEYNSDEEALADMEDARASE